MRSKIFYLLVSVACSPTLIFAQAQDKPKSALQEALPAEPTAGLFPTAPLPTPMFSYDIEAALTYIDGLRRDSSSSAIPRTLGLRRLRAALAWQAGRSSALRLVLRPDAVNQVQESGAAAPREIDTRASDTTPGGMQPMPTIRLVDGYEFALYPAPNVEVAAGVFAAMTPERNAYPELLGFGLNVLFPAKFSGARLSWQNSRAAVPATSNSQGARPETGLLVDLYVLHGDEDRAEALAPKHASYDSAPAAKDPYYGSGLDLFWRLAAESSVGLLAGYVDATDLAGSADAQRYDDSFARMTVTQLLGDVTTGSAAARATKLNLDLRYAKSKWRDHNEDVQRYSAKVTASVPVAMSFWGLAGIGYGKADRWRVDSDRTTTVPLVGYLLEAGVMHEIAADYFLQAMVSHERRDTHGSNGNQVGGFSDGSGRAAVVQRFGLELSYQLHASS